MNFLIDAQLPRRLIRLFQRAGHDAIHTLDLPRGNRTTDQEIISLCAQEQRVVITKDADFADSFWLLRQPQKLLLVSTGNISNQELEMLFKAHLDVICAEFVTHDYIELTRIVLTVHV